ncbi:MAG: hypothetical protein KAJ19_03720 [Gammaproteobacteria bacterium]|nr:hypothetical protein [Gammaproteobacteria bacterium]
MDMKCQKCGEPWDLYSIMHEEGGGVDAIANAPAGQDEIECNGFTMVDVIGRNEMPEGHFVLDGCPCCPKAGQEQEWSTIDDPLPLGEVISDPNLDPEDRKALAAALVS